MKTITDKRRVLEITAVLFTALGKFLFIDFLKWRLPFVICAILGWAIYVFHRYKKNPDILEYWGIRIDNFDKVMRLIIPYGIISVILFFIIGYFQNSINLTWHIIPILILYPIWGIIQQFLTISLIAGNIKDLKQLKLKRIAIVLITSVLFAGVHYPSFWLMLATFVLALFYSTMYLKIKNIIVMGIFHGWLGTLFYYTVLNLDPFQDAFMKFL